MSPNRKAELQRKLSLASIPRPPAGLADRIKSDIPQHLLAETEQQRQRLGRAVAFNVRVAASILLLVGSLFFALHLLNRAYVEEEGKMAEIDKSLRTNHAPAAATSPTAMYRNQPQVVTSTAQAPTVVTPPRLEAAKPAKPQMQLADARSEAKKKDEQSAGRLDAYRERDSPKVTPAAADRFVAPAPPPPASAPASVSEQITVVSPAPVVSPPAATAEPQPTPAPTVYAETERATKNSAGAVASSRKASPNLDLLKSAQAADLAFAAPVTFFGYDIAEKSLDRVTPLVQHFAAPELRPKRGVRIEADLAPSPLDAAKDVLRISLDTPARSGGPDASAAPVAADARLEIDVNPDAVTSRRAVTGEPSSSERVLVEGVSLTALYELELKPSLPPHTRVATIRLHYRSLPDGRERAIARDVRAGDLAKSWDRAPIRTKRASLAAALGETRKGGGDATPIAGKARAIGLTELAELASRH